MFFGWFIFVKKFLLYYKNFCIFFINLFLNNYFVLFLGMLYSGIGERKLFNLLLILSILLCFKIIFKKREREIGEVFEDIVCFSCVDVVVREKDFIK